MMNLLAQRIVDPIPNPDDLRIRILKRTFGSIRFPGSKNRPIKFDLTKIGRKNTDRELKAAKQQHKLIKSAYVF